MCTVTIVLVDAQTLIKSICEMHEMTLEVNVCFPSQLCLQYTALSASSACLFTAGVAADARHFPASQDAH